MTRTVVLGWLLVAWTLICLVGLAFGAVTEALPPHRFLELLVVVPGLVAIAHVVGWMATSVADRAGTVAGGVVAVVAAAAVAVPGVAAWYGSGSPKPWIEPAALQQAGVVAAWAGTLPPGEPFVILVGPTGTAGTLSAALKERTIRVALPADRQEGLHLFVGTYADLQARRRPATPNPDMNAAIEPYWEDVRPLLASDAPVAILQAFDGQDFGALAGRGPDLGHGAILIRGVYRGPPLEPAPAPDAFPGTVGAIVWAAILLAVLFLAGAGWTAAILDRDAEPPVALGMAPAVGAGVLILAGTAVSRAGVPLGGAAGAATVVVVGAAGYAVAAVRRRGR